MTVKELVDRFGIRKEGKDSLRIQKSASALSALEEIKRKKAEIISYLDAELEAEKRAREERRVKIQEIEGLEEIRAAIDDFEAWREEFERSFEHCGGLGVRKKPEYDFDALFAKYPVAHAYINAESKANSDNCGIASIGRKALDAIIENPQNYVEAIEEMDREMIEFSDRHSFD